MRRRWSGRVHPWPGAEGEGLPQYRQTVQLCCAGRRPGGLVGEHGKCCKPAGDGCSTFMVIALTRAFWRPNAKECVKKQDRALLSLCV